MRSESWPSSRGEKGGMSWGNSPSASSSALIAWAIERGSSLALSPRSPKQTIQVSDMLLDLERIVRILRKL